MGTTGEDIKAKIHVALFFANLLFGVNLALYHTIIADYITFQQLFYVKLFFSALFFIPFILTKKRYKITVKDVFKLIGVAILIMYGREYLLLWGIGYTTPIDSAVLATLAPIVTLVISAMLVREKLHFFKITGIILGLGGAMLFMISDRQGLSSSFGNILIFCSVVAAASNTVFSKTLLMKMGTMKVMGWYYIVGMLIATPLFWDDFVTIPVDTLPTKAFIEIGIVVVFGTILPNALLYFGTEKATSIHTALYFYIQPITTAVLTYFRGSLQIDHITIYAASLIFTGVILIIVNYEKFSFPKIKFN